MLRYQRVTFREWGTWPARDARTSNRNVRFKTWDWGLAWDWAWLDRGRCPHFASHSSLPPTSPSPPALPLSVPVPPTTPPALAHECLISIKNQELCNLLHRGGVVAGWQQNCALLIWVQVILSTTTLITNSKFGCICNNPYTKLLVRQENVVHRLQNSRSMSRGRDLGWCLAVPRERPRGGGGI
jgi:hypothetical protein